MCLSSVQNFSCYLPNRILINKSIRNYRWENKRRRLNICKADADKFHAKLQTNQNLIIGGTDKLTSSNNLNCNTFDITCTTANHPCIYIFRHPSLILSHHEWINSWIKKKQRGTSITTCQYWKIIRGTLQPYLRCSVWTIQQMFHAQKKLNWSISHNRQKFCKMCNIRFLLSVDKSKQRTCLSW